MKKLILTLLVLLLSVTIVNAANETTAEVNRDQQIITITGKLGVVRANKRLTVAVLQKGYDFATLPTVTSDTVMTYYNHVAEVYTDSNGNYTTSFSITSPSGRYNFRVSDTTQKGLYYYGSFDYYGPDSVKPILDDLALVVNDTQKLKSKLTDLLNAMILGLNFNLYGGYDFTNLDDDIYGLIGKNPIAFSSATQLKTAYLQAVATHLINTSVDAATIDRVLTECDGSFNILDKSPYSIYQRLSGAAKTAVVNSLINTTFSSSQDITDTFFENSLLQAIYVVDGYTSLRKLIEDNNIYYGVNLQAYQKLKSTAYVDKTFSGKLFSSLSDFRTQFDYMVLNNPYEPVVTKPRESSGGGAGGGKGIAPIVIVSNDNTNSPPVIEELVKQTFKDLNEAKWASESIEKLYNLKIISGKTVDSFAPNDNLTREEFIKMIVLAFDIKGEGSASEFMDVDNTQWYAHYIAIAKEKGICNGVSGEQFGVGMPITRQDMATMIFLALKATDTTLKSVEVDEKTFIDDNQISDYAKTAIKTMQKAQIINGFEDGRFAPTANSTRAEAAKMLYGLLQQKGDIQ